MTSKKEPSRGKTKNALKRYQILDQCFQLTIKKFTIKKLVEVLEENDIYVSERTIYEDIKHMRSAEGYNAPILDVNAIYYYDDPYFTINHSPLKPKDKKTLKDAIELLTQIGSFKGFEGVESVATQLLSSLELNEAKKQIISFSENEHLKGINFLQSLFQAISNEHVLIINYKSFKVDQLQVYLFSPYYLKQYNNRWFLFGQNHKEEFVEQRDLQNLALDRIEFIEIDLKTKYIPTEVNFKDYFKLNLGVTRNENSPIQKIRLQFSPKRLPYVTSKPIHHPQIVIGDIVQFTVRINPELISLILSYGADVKVLEPRVLVEQIKEEAKKMYANY